MTSDLTREKILQACRDDSRVSYWAGKIADSVKDSRSPSE